jgi:hypothetical protein
MLTTKRKNTGPPPGSSTFEERRVVAVVCEFMQTCVAHAMLVCQKYLLRSGASE